MKLSATERAFPQRAAPTRNRFRSRWSSCSSSASKIIGSQQNGPEYLYEALEYVAQGKVKSIIETYPLAEAAKAYERVAEGKARFRAVLTM